MSNNVRQEILDTSPLSIKYINDNFKNICFKLFGNINAMDIQDNSITAKKIKTNELIVGVNIQMGDSATIKWSQVTEQPDIPAEYTDQQAIDAWKTSGYATYITAGGIYTGEVVAHSLKGYSGYMFAEVMDDSYGGKLNIYDVNGFLNARIGTESGTGSNMGGSLILYKDSPYDTNPSCESYQRVEMGINKTNYAGGAIFRDNVARDKVSITAGASNSSGSVVVSNSSGYSTIITAQSISIQGAEVITTENHDIYFPSSGGSNVTSQGEDIIFTTTDTNIAIYKASDGVPYISAGTDGTLYVHGHSHGTS